MVCECGVFRSRKLISPTSLRVLKVKVAYEKSLYQFNAEGVQEMVLHAVVVEHENVGIQGQKKALDFVRIGFQEMNGIWVS